MEHSNHIKTWRWAALTQQGVYLGEVTGEMEPGETSEEAAVVVAETVRKFLPQVQDVPKIAAVFVSESMIYVDATGDLIQVDVSLEFEKDSAATPRQIVQAATNLKQQGLNIEVHNLEGENK